MEEYLELLNLYCLDGKRKLVRLRELWEAHDYKTYGIEVHGLKSASANVGAMSVSVSAREHEKAADRGDEAYVDGHIHQLLTEYEEQIGHISSFLADSQQSRKEKQEARRIAAADLIQEIREALESLENFRAKECARRIEALLECQLEPEIEVQLTEVQGLLKLYEDEKAEQLLRNMLEMI